MVFRLLDLVDYEAQQSRDVSQSPETLQHRDGRLSERMGLAGHGKRDALAAWLRELRLGKGPWPGASMLRAYEASTFVIGLVGTVLGIATVQGLLHYDGSEPVNVIPFLAIYGLLQIAFLIWYFGKTVIAGLMKRLPANAALALCREYALRWLHKHPQLFRLQAGDDSSTEVFRQRMQDLHPRLLQNLAWKLFQVFGLSFHFASLACFVLMIAFNDYTFAWRTTLHWDAAIFHRIVTVFALPFAWLHPYLAPSQELVAASQFNRFQKEFIGALGSPMTTAAWWPFLAAVILAYGLLPRFLIWLWLTWNVRSYLSRWDFADYASEKLWLRLSTKTTGWNSSEPEPLRPVPEQSLQRGPEAPLEVVLLRWRDPALPLDELTAFLAQRSIAVASEREARGLAADPEAVAALLSRGQALLVVSDPFELPGEAIDKIRLAVRRRFPQGLIYFAPLERRGGALVLGGDRNAWNHALRIYRDPYLGLLEDVP